MVEKLVAAVTKTSRGIVETSGGGRNISRDGQKINRGLVKNLVAVFEKFEKLVALVKTLDATLSKN